MYIIDGEMKPKTNGLRIRAWYFVEGARNPTDPEFGVLVIPGGAPFYVAIGG